jgi:hypothetical protein
VEQECKGMWAAVLGLALEDAKGGDFQMEALDWLSSNRKTLCSFFWVCDVLDLEPLSIREAVQMEHRRRSQAYV